MLAWQEGACTILLQLLISPCAWVPAAGGSQDPCCIYYRRVAALSCPGRGGPVCTNLGLKPGQRLTVKGTIPPNAKSFVMNLGKDSTHLGLHFNPRFDAHGDVNTIVCNSKKVEEWGAEQRETVFPFQKGTPTEVTFSINPSDVTVHLTGHQFTFPNRLGLSVFDYFDTHGDFTLQSISWE
uniref:Galectin n=1 Tax=Cairina moschata TaxID=8855 RepID=A0A8C3BFP3_CAIMO